jgi:hypothetical protein
VTRKWRRNLLESRETDSEMAAPARPSADRAGARSFAPVALPTKGAKEHEHNAYAGTLRFASAARTAGATTEPKSSIERRIALCGCAPTAICMR